MAAVAYRRILVPLEPGGEEAVAMACLLASERGSRVSAPAVLEVPNELPLDAHLEAAEAAAAALGAEARALGERYGVRLEPAIVRARASGPAIVAAAHEHGAEIVLVAVPRPRGRRTRVPAAADYVLHHAHCRVVVVAAS